MDHLRAEGYTDRDMPHERELLAALREFYRAEERTVALAKVIPLAQAVG
jgi:hypothetical protein